MVLDASNLVASKVEDTEVLQTPENVRGDQMDEVSIKSQLQQLSLVEKGPGLQGRDTVVLEVQIMKVPQVIQVLKSDLYNAIVLEEDGLCKARKE